MFYSCEKSILRKNLVLPIEKFLSLVLPRNAIMLQHLTIQLTLYYLSSGCLRRVKNKRKCQTFSSKSGRGCLQEVPNIVIWLGNFWSLRRGGRLQEVVATGGLTVPFFSVTFWWVNSLILQVAGFKKPHVFYKLSLIHVGYLIEFEKTIIFGFTFFT